MLYYFHISYKLILCFAWVFCLYFVLEIRTHSCNENQIMLNYVLLFPALGILWNERILKRSCDMSIKILTNIYLFVFLFLFSTIFFHYIIYFFNLVVSKNRGVLPHMPFFDPQCSPHAKIHNVYIYNIWRTNLKSQSLYWCSAN